MSFKNFSLIFLGIAILELISNFFIETFPLFHYLVKPLIMISLSWFFWREMREQYKGVVIFMQIALLFSWLGDVFLMGKGDLFFILGLGSFLLSQLGYAWVFSRQSGNLLKGKPYLALAFVLYGGLLVFVVWSGLGPLKVPVVFYALAILTMGIMALNRNGAVSDKSFNWVLWGAVLFIISDSLIALNKFAFDIPLSKTWIMATYMGAQYLIVMGYIAGRKPGAF